MILSKTLHPGDLDRLPDELKIVDAYFTSEREQHPMRRWEYAMALRAYDRWCGEQTKATDLAGDVVDVGGAGSPFSRMIASPEPCHVVDPDGGDDLASYLRRCPPLAEAVFCLSVLEHVEDLDRFCYHLSCLVAPGGLLFLTVDYCSDRSVGDAVDGYHFHWMRRRIFSSYTLGALTSEFFRRDFSLFGEADFTWHGAQVYDYSFASLALIKRP